MTVELDEVRSFLADHEPFSRLPAEALDVLPAHMAITYVRRGETIVRRGERNDTLYVIRSGAVDVLSDDDVLIDRRDTGRNFGYSTLIDAPESRYSMVAVEDCLILTLPRESFTRLVAEHPHIGRYFQSASLRVRAAAKEMREAGAAADVLRTPLSEVVAGRNLVTIGADASISAAARLMDDRQVSCLVVEGAAEPGILTDRDLRSRVVAVAADPSRPVAEVMTSPVRMAAPETLVFEAMLLMGELGIHHLPVAGPEGISAVATSNDIMRQLQSDPIYLSADVAHSDLAELAGSFRRAASVAARFLDRGASAFEAQRLLSSIADSIARRLTVLGVEEVGPPPVPFAFVAVGSQARHEMGPASDQDNAFVLSDAYDEGAHAAYFSALGEFICDGLAEAGQARCPGGMMASSPQWRMTESQWAETFHTWVTAPNPDALLHAQVFFDFRCLAGETELAGRVHDAAQAAARGSRRFHAHLAALATRREPPLSFFRGFVLERSGDYAATLDVKKGGTAAVVQMARLYAITAGETELDTVARIRAAAGSSISSRGADDLIDAYEYITTLALRHQAEQLRAGENPDYHIDPRALSSRDRDDLRDSFRVIKSLQAALSSQYPVRSM
ncbi:Putative nucleotidyltransferase substrate binding domain protein [Corynebacterium capitovis DSM 44611]|uniref:putative nucleotidyltransferase substrate binding domain-containing protein n=1 Tax=Corynebacterium capitovis TaxID=131081 RepID=UPI000372C3E2|nr:putative nucleotidyltransferase substrate binding domain-containing protein [Corynebacterium capitovis]WKD57790.1 Putative nucleotidyltransferase substrate binding domain protein [Corynebacterium capitovis DSM 44611]